MNHDDKLCATCGRVITWRKSLHKNWAEVRHCSDGCRRQKPNADDLRLEATILQLLSGRARGATICPSEAARVVFGDTEDRWRLEMERARRAARRLVSSSMIDIVQQGRVVDASTAKGPIRLRLRG